MTTSQVVADLTGQRDRLRAKLTREIDEHADTRQALRVEVARREELDRRLNDTVIQLDIVRREFERLRQRTSDKEMALRDMSRERDADTARVNGILNRITRTLHEYGDTIGADEEFDEMLESIGLDRRTRTYLVHTEVTVEVVVPVVTHSEARAVEMIHPTTLQDRLASMTSVLDFEITHHEVRYAEVDRD